MRSFWFVVFFSLVFSPTLHAACLIHNSQTEQVQTQNDLLYKTLSKLSDCPTDVRELKLLLKEAQSNVQPAMVANRGRNNPRLGSFSFFEMVSSSNENTPVEKGDFFFGHFTGLDGKEIVLDQEPSGGKLLIELIAWDPVKKLYNFYELIGTPESADWFYRGDSVDILNDNAFVYRDPPPHTLKFGRTLRCSACHSSGGPIMKELELPHNDWWTQQRPLVFAPNQPSSEVQSWMSEVVDASAFAEAVKAGIHKLESSPSYQSARAKLSLQERLRPLFCENEINLESDILPGDAFAPSLAIPGSFLINPLLAEAPLSLSHEEYAKLLRKFNMQFPETTHKDADHAWLTPVKSYSDLLAIQTLIEKNIIDIEFATDVLAIDFQKPLFSKKRCALLKALPETVSENWRDIFVDSLEHSKLDGSMELARYLKNSKYTQTWHHQRIHDYILSVKDRMELFFPDLLNRRREVFESEISKNPRGQILEPGFRVIFPVPN